MRRRPARAFLLRMTSRALCVTLLIQTFPAPAAGARIKWVDAPEFQAPVLEQPEETWEATPPAPEGVEDFLTDSPPSPEPAPPPPAPRRPAGRPTSTAPLEEPADLPALETEELPPARAPDEVVQPALTPRDLPPVPPGVAPSVALLAASSFVPGWNLASVQNEPVDKSPAAVFSSIAGQFTRVFAYDACTPGDPWKLYDPANAAASDLTVVDQKIGFWIEMTAPATVPNPGSLADETTIHLCTGWNLIGFPAEQARPVRTALASIEGKYARVFGYDPADTTDPWEVYDVAVPAWANDLELMQPGRGYWVLATVETDLTIANVGAEPEVAITAPADLAVVTAPSDIQGTIRSDRLQNWTLSYRAHGEAEATVFASGNTPIVNGRLGTLDPTLLLNGGYTIELTATDFNGQSSTDEIEVNVEGPMKIGNFTLQYLDLEIPLSGLPIRIYRNYDSRDKSRGDFGVGWTLELRQGSYRNNRKPGEGWQISSGFLPCQNILETKSHVTTIRFSDREIYRFRLRLASPAPTLGGCFAQARFDFVDGPVPGATLAILGNTEVIYQNGADYVVDSGSFELYEPQDVRLTTRDGRVFDLDLQQGVTRLEDLNGNRISITPTAITHSSGRSIAFQRDAIGRVIRMTDSKGESLLYNYDSGGDLIAVTDRESNVTRFAYDGSHGLLSIEDPLGRNPVRNEYDAAGRLLRTIDAAGKAIEYNHEIGNRREIVTDRLGQVRVLYYDSRGNVIREVDPNGKETVRTFDSDDRLLSETNPLGHTRSFSYNANGDLTSETNPLGHQTSYTYDSRGEVLTTTDARGKITTNAYDARGNLVSVTDPLGNTISYTYDARGNFLTEADAEGKVKSYEYDSFGNLIQETDPLGHKISYTYDANGNRLTKSMTRTTDVGMETITWSFAYDKAGRLIQTTDPDGSTSVSSYDSLGNQVETVDKLNRRTTFSYNASGRLTLISYPDGTTEQVAYDAEDRRSSHQDRAGRITRFEYSPIGRLTRVIHPDGSSSTETYDDAGRLIASADGRGNITTYENDIAGRRIKLRDPLGKETVLGYDANGNRTSVQDARGQTTIFEYDDTNRLVRIVFPDGTSKASAYDRAGRLIEETDQSGRPTRFGYDAAGRLVTVTDSLGGVTRYGYDELGNRTSQTDANGQVTTFAFDALGRLIKRTLPLGQLESRTYDAIGNLRSRTDLGGSSINYTYDVNDRQVSRLYPDGSTVSFTYTPTGQRASATDSRGTTIYEYDSRDRLVAAEDPSGRRLTYGYDPAGNRTSLTLLLGSGSFTTSYGYDPANRLESVTDPQARAYTYGRDENGRRTSLVYPNGVRTSYAYDSLGRLLNLTTQSTSGGSLQSYLYTLAPTGHRTQIEEHDGTVRIYGYDAVYRVTRESVSGPGGYEDVFTHDPVGNRMTRVRTDGSGTMTSTYLYDERDRLLSDGTSSYSWDANGNLISKSGSEGATYVWDVENRLTGVLAADGTVVNHAYDADGNRVRTEITPANGPPTVINYVVDVSASLNADNEPPGLSHVVAELDGADQLDVLYVRGEELLASVRASGTRFYHADGLGSIRALTDENGSVTDSYAFAAFGDGLEHAGSDPNPYLFTGEPLDTETGLYYLRARWMDPRSGRFLSSDPADPVFEIPATLHRYLYTQGDPVNHTDPTGLFGFSVAGLSVSINIQGNLRSTSGSISIRALLRTQARLLRLNIQAVKRVPKVAGRDVHHLIEQRLWKSNPALRQIFKSVDDIPGVSLSKAEHQVFTNAWRQIFPYSNQAGHIAKPTLEQIIQAASQIYAGHPQLLKAIFLALL